MPEAAPRKNISIARPTLAIDRGRISPLSDEEDEYRLDMENLRSFLMEKRKEYTNAFFKVLWNAPVSYCGKNYPPGVKFRPAQVMLRDLNNVGILQRMIECGMIALISSGAPLKAQSATPVAQTAGT